MSIKSLLIVAIALASIACSSSKKSIEKEDSNISFEKHSGFEDHMALAQAENKLLFVDFYADWCLPCKMMDEEVFSDKDLSEYFNTNFINVKIDAERGQGPDLSVMYEIRGYPTLIFMDPDGRVLLRKEGMAYHSELFGMADEALEIFENQ